MMEAKYSYREGEEEGFERDALLFEEGFCLTDFSAEEKKSLKGVSIDSKRKVWKNGKIVVPKHAQRAVMSACHKSKFSAMHLPLRQTLANATRKYIWTNMTRHIKDSFKSCVRCQSTLISSKRKSVRGSGGIRTDTPLEFVVTDYIVAKGGEGGWNYCLIFIDAFSKWRYLVKTRGRTTEEFLRGMKEFLGVVGRIGNLVSDKEASFNSKEAKDFYKKHGINYLPADEAGDHLHTAIVESENKTFRRFQQNLARKDEWPRHLPDYVMSENARPSIIQDLTIFDLFLPTNSHLSTIALRKSVRYKREIKDLREKENFVDFKRGEKVLIRPKEGVGHDSATSGIILGQIGTGKYKVKLHGDRLGFYKHDRLTKLSPNTSFFDTKELQIGHHPDSTERKEVRDPFVPMKTGHFYWIQDGEEKSLGKCVEVFGESAKMHHYEKKDGHWRPIWTNDITGDLNVKRKKGKGDHPFIYPVYRSLITGETRLTAKGDIKIL
jgi:hypothetical protein